MADAAAWKAPDQTQYQAPPYPPATQATGTPYTAPYGDKAQQQQYGAGAQGGPVNYNPAGGYQQTSTHPPPQGYPYAAPYDAAGGHYGVPTEQTGSHGGAMARFGKTGIIALCLLIGGFFLPFLWVVAALLPCCIRPTDPKRPFVTKVAIFSAILLLLYLIVFGVLFGVGWTNWRNTGYNCPCRANDFQCRNVYGC